DTDADDAAAQLGMFLDAGGTLVDTADVYTGCVAELVLGRLLRDQVPPGVLVISTYAVVTPKGRRPRDASRRHLIAAVDESLSRLGVDYVDLWQLHTYDPEVPLDETLAALDAIVSSGRALYAGVCDYAGWQLAAAAVTQRSVPGRAPDRKSVV